MELQPYSPIRQVAENLWVVDGEWYDTPFKRRMTIVRTPSSGKLWIHSAILLREEDYRKLDELGEVAWVVAPNDMHTSEGPQFHARYPRAKLLLSVGAALELRKSGKAGGQLLPVVWTPEHLGAEITNTLEIHAFLGTRWLNENVFFHVPSRTLITTDLVFNLWIPKNPILKFFYRLNRVYDRFGPSRLFRYLFVRDPQAARESVEEILKWNFDRVIMSHGEILESTPTLGARERFAQGFAEMGLRSEPSHHLELTP